MKPLKQTILSMIVISICAAEVAAITPKANLMCAVTNIAECEVLKGCSNQLPADVNFPAFFNIDFKNQVIIGDSKTQKIGTIEFTSEGIVLQGVGPQYRAWSLLLNNEQTKVTGHVTGHHYGFTLFGLCSSENQ